MPQIALCECSSLPSLDELCDKDCQQHQKRLSIQNGELVVKSEDGELEASFGLSALSGRSQAMFGNLSCQAESCTALLYSISEGEFALLLLIASWKVADLLWQQAEDTLLWHVFAMCCRRRHTGTLRSTGTTCFGLE